jgi:hypothetical protein
VVPETRVPVELGGRGAWLRFSLFSLAEAQKAAGCGTFEELMSRLVDLEKAAGGRANAFAVDLPAFGAILWAGLLEWADEAGETVDRQALMRSLGMGDFARLLAAVVTALNLSFRSDAPAPDEPAAGDADPPTVAAAA